MVRIPDGASDSWHLLTFTAGEETPVTLGGRHIKWVHTPPPSSQFDPGALRQEPDTADQSTAAVTADRIDQVTDDIRSFEGPVESERDGVLVADADPTVCVG